MLATARSNEFLPFIRKIGFSVGLEYTLDRIRDFATFYASNEVLSFGDVTRLLHAPKPSGWGLELGNEHVLDVLRSFGVLSVVKGEVSVLELGESLGILRKLQNDSDFETSLHFLFAHALILADGDIFLNAMAACFEPADFSARASRMLEYKWSVLEEMFPAPRRRAAIYQAINIEAQQNNPGSRGHGVGGRNVLNTKSELSRRTGPLQERVERPEPKISEAYLRKALPRRRAWARSLSFIDDADNQTKLGITFLETLGNKGLGGPGCLAVWPLAYELNSPVFTNAKLVGSTIYSSWEFLVLVGQAMGLIGEQRVPTAVDQRAGIELMTTFLETFRSLNHSKRILRKELPGRVAYRCALACNIGRKTFPPYPAILAQEQDKPSPRIVARPSRFAEIALS